MDELDNSNLTCYNVTKGMAPHVINYLIKKHYGINIVTCPSCWVIMTHSTDHIRWYITCTACGTIADRNLFFDFIY